MGEYTEFLLNKKKVENTYKKIVIENKSLRVDTSLILFYIQNIVGNNREYQKFVKNKDKSECNWYFGEETRKVAIRGIKEDNMIVFIIKDNN